MAIECKESFVMELGNGKRCGNTDEVLISGPSVFMAFQLKAPSALDVISLCGVFSLLLLLA